MSRLEWILTGFLALLIVAVAVMGLLFWDAQRQQSKLLDTSGSADESSQADNSQHTARSAYETAEPVAREWAEDAELLTARASWDQGTEFAAKKANWGFLFYSKGQRSTALISVAEGRARLIRSSKADKPLDPLTIGAWQIDSPAVLEQVMANGGREFIDRNDNANLTLTLDALREFQWEAKLVDVGTQKVLTLKIDPVNGAITAPSSPQVQN